MIDKSFIKCYCCNKLILNKKSNILKHQYSTKHFLCSKKILMDDLSLKLDEFRKKLNEKNLKKQPDEIIE